MSHLELPRFRYLPEPLENGLIIEADVACACCGEKRGAVCLIPPDTEEGIENICPWCVADGSAAELFDVEFTDPAAFDGTEISKDTIAEIVRRTPAVLALPTEDTNPEWPVHCDDGCAFRGEVKNIEALRAFPAETWSEFKNRYGLSETELEKFIYDYHPVSSWPVLYRFDCLHCGAVRLVKVDIPG